MKFNQLGYRASFLNNGLRYVAIAMVIFGGVTYWAPNWIELLPKQLNVEEINYQELTLKRLVEQIGENTGEAVSVKFIPHRCNYSLSAIENARANHPSEVIVLFSNKEKNEMLEVRFQTFYYGSLEDKQRTNSDGEYIAQLGKCQTILNRLCGEKRDITVRGYVSNESGTTLNKKINTNTEYTKEERQTAQIKKISRIVLLCQYFTYEDKFGNEIVVNATTESDEIENAILYCDRLKNHHKISTK